MMKEWLAAGAGGGQIGDLVEAAVRAGARAKNPFDYQTGMKQRWMQAVLQAGRLFGQGEVGAGLVHAGKAGVLTLPALADASVWPVLDFAVPRLKLGAFLDKARFDIDRLGPNADPETVRLVLQDAWDSLDNRYGEMVLDNLFWNRTYKDLLHLTVRSVGWVLGDLREFGGAGMDVARVPGQLVRGKPYSQVNLNKLSFVLGAITTVALLSAIYQRVHTGQGPQEPMDYFFPKNGEIDQYGRPMRSSIYGYAKDLFDVYHHPVATASGKVAPLINLISEMIRNRDFYNTKIRNADDPLIKQAEDTLAHIPTAFEPLAIKNLRKEMERSGAGLDRQSAENFIGITPAPAAASQGPGEQLAHDIASEKSGEARTPAKVAHSQLKANLERSLREHKTMPEDVAAAVRGGHLTRRDLRDAARWSHETPLDRTMSSFTLEEAMRVYRKATAEEKREIRPLLRKKAVSAMRAAPPAERADIAREYAEALQ